MIRKEFVTVDGKNYSVTVSETGSISIWTNWQVPCIADLRRLSVRPRMIDKSASVSPYGRLGKKVLAVLNINPQ
jgi:hypothetical protein